MGWEHLGRFACYRSLPAGALYAPKTSWATDSGRFDDGVRATLYVSTTAEGAVAEFFRPRAHLLLIRDVVKLRLYKLDMQVAGRVMAVISGPDAVAAGIEPERLTSNDADETTRYRECRALADRVEADGGVGIRFPGAAHVDHPPNVVVFGEPSPASWCVPGVVEVEDGKEVAVEAVITYDA